MTELVDRLTHLADAAMADQHLVDPSTGASPAIAADGRRSRPPWARLGAAAAVLLLALAVAALVVRDGENGDDGPVTAGPETTATDPSTTATPGITDPPADVVAGDPVLSIAFQLVNGDSPLGLAVTVRDAAGAVVAERTSAEVEEPQPDGSTRVRITRGIVVPLPGEGAYTVDLAGGAAPVTCEVGTVLAGDRVILPITTTDDGAPWCNRVEDMEDWAFRSGTEGEQYLGLTEAEARDRIAAAGRTVQVAGRDGIDLPVIREDQPGRVDLMVFADVVVFAQVEDEALTTEAPQPREPLAVVVMATNGVLVGNGEVTVRAGEETTIRTWETGSEAAVPGVSLLFDDLHPGPVEVEVAGDGACLQDVDLPRGGAVVTFMVPPDGSLPHGGPCDAMVETVDEHVARVGDGFDQHLLVAYVGLSEAEARARVEEEGRELRVLARDGLTFGRDDDLRTDRVNLVLYDDQVRAAALF